MIVLERFEAKPMVGVKNAELAEDVTYTMHEMTGSHMGADTYIMH